MKIGAWLWGIGLVLGVIASGTGWLVRISPVLIAVPSGLFAVGAGAFCIGRPGLVTPSRIWSCIFAGLLSLMTATHLPFRAVFLAYRNDLEQTARGVAGGNPCHCRSAGCFQLESSQIHADGSVYLWTRDTRTERIGFVKTTAPGVVGALHEIDLGQGWRYVIVKGT